jgi:tetratricopeptide (TPR) repeat protein
MAKLNMASESFAAAIICHLNDILASPGFVRSKRLGAFLTWVVERSVAGDHDSITERNIALLVYGRPADFDPKIDGTVRAEAMRLRHKLREYYEQVSDGAPRIEIPKGTYTASFIGFESEPALLAVPVLPRDWVLPVVVAIAGLLLLALAGGWYFYSRTSYPASALSASAQRMTAEADRLRLMGDNAPALTLLDQAVILDPNIAAVHLARAAVLQNLGHDRDARVEVARAQELAAREGHVDPVIATRIQARTHVLHLDYSLCTAMIRAMLAQQPISMDLDLLELQLGLPDSDLAVSHAAITAARRLPDAGKNPELDRLEALLLGGEGKTEAAIKIVLRGEQKAVALHATSEFARLRLLEIGLLHNHVENPAANSVGRQVLVLCESLHDDICLARAYRVEGNYFAITGHYQQALRTYHQGLPIAREWQNWIEIDRLLEGIDFAVAGLSPLHPAVDLRDPDFQVIDAAFVSDRRSNIRTH